MRKKLLGLIAGLSMALTACAGMGGSGSAPKDDSKVAQESVVTSSSTASESAGSSSSTASAGTSASNGTTSAVEEKEAEKFPAFKSVDIAGNEITEAVFAENDITMVNIWGTFCGPCIKEMPELQDIYSKLPENANLVGIVVDVTAGAEAGVNTANTILENNGVKFTNILLDESMMVFMQRFSLIPTTIFVDREGNIVGETIIGAMPESYVAQLESLLEGWKYE